MFLVNSPIVRGDNLRFREEGVREVISRVLLPWLNSSDSSLVRSHFSRRQRDMSSDMTSLHPHRAMSWSAGSWPGVNHSSNLSRRRRLYTAYIRSYHDCLTSCCSCSNAVSIGIIIIGICLSLAVCSTTYISTDHGASISVTTSSIFIIIASNSQGQVTGRCPSAS